uniref:Fibrinogen C-terminal domain-containing protein n=1 Tax=Amphimedon queenslandica TaxID=400682 RepID=A0A1X7TMD2_AMPQE
MAKQLEQFYETPIYTSTQTYENAYELEKINRKEGKMRSQESLLSSALPSTRSMEPKQNQSSWSKPLLFNTVLLCLILFLLLGIVGWLAYDSYHAANVDKSTTINANNCSANVNEWSDHVAQILYDKLNFTAWADDVVSNGNSNVTPGFHERVTGVIFNITGSLPDFNEWANSVVSKVNSNVTGSLPDFNEWANGVVSKVNSNVTGSLPDFNEWANSIVSKVNSNNNVTGSLPNFNEWANGVVSKVNSNVTGSLPNFNEWANGVVSKVNSNVTGSLPDFNEWANSIVSKVNSNNNVTGSLPNFNEWANGVVSKVNSNVTGSLPNFNEWANGVVSKVNSNVTGSLPDFNEWANSIVSKVNSNNNVTGSLPNFNEWANGVVSKVNSNVTGSLPNFNEWANGVVSKVNSNVTGSLPDFNEWANSIVSKVNSNNNVTGSLPNFNEWANGVVSKVNSNVTGSLPNFNEWANGVVSKVNSNVTGSLPDFNEWANGVSQNVFHLLLQNYPNFTEHFSHVENILHTTKASAQRLINIVNTLSNLQGTSTSTAGVVDEMLLVAHELLLLHNGSNPLPTSCQQLKSQYPGSLSGYYVLTGNGMTYTAYCDMDVLCGSGGGWTRLAYLDMSDATQNCPSGFKLYQSEGVRACGRTNSGAGCVSVSFPSNNLNYSQICGRVKGYQFDGPDAIDNPSINWYRNSINSYYVDGVSITCGSSH